MDPQRRISLESTLASLKLVIPRLRTRILEIEETPATAPATTVHGGHGTTVMRLLDRLENAERSRQEIEAELAADKG